MESWAAGCVVGKFRKCQLTLQLNANWLNRFSEAQTPLKWIASIFLDNTVAGVVEARFAGRFAGRIIIAGA